MKPESLFTIEFKKACFYFDPKCFYIKIPDMPLGTEDREKLPDWLKFNPKKPFDIIVISNGIPFAFELKVLKFKDSINFGIISDRQKASLQKFQDSGGKAYIVIKISENLAFYMSIDKWINLEKFIDWRKSFIPQKEQIISKIKHNRSTVWELNKILLLPYQKDLKV